jgi:hypothetical protein
MSNGTFFGSATAGQAIRDFAGKVSQGYSNAINGYKQLSQAGADGVKYVADGFEQTAVGKTWAGQFVAEAARDGSQGLANTAKAAFGLLDGSTEAAIFRGAATGLNGLAWAAENKADAYVLATQAVGDFIEGEINQAKEEGLPKYLGGLTGKAGAAWLSGGAANGVMGMSGYLGKATVGSAVVGSTGALDGITVTKELDLEVPPDAQ